MMLNKDDRVVVLSAIEREPMPIFAWMRRYRQIRALASADADALIARYGEAAYANARERAHQARFGKIVDGNRPAEHWDRVRQIIGRKTNKEHLDTATRYLDDPEA